MAGAKQYTDQIVQIEWEMFDKVQNIGGRAACQDNYPMFYAMRASQFDAWSDQMRESYLGDLLDARADGWNLLTEKYAYMTGYAYMGDLEELETKLSLVMSIMDQMNKDTVEMHNRYPMIAKMSRPLDDLDNETVSVDRYLQCELMTYSLNTLGLMAEYLSDLARSGKSLPLMILENTVHLMGYADIQQAEQRCAQLGS